MDEFDFGKIDRELEHELRDSNASFDWNPGVTDREPPPRNNLVPIGEYTGIDLDLSNIIIDSDYIVWIEVFNPERNCKVFFN
jgi:hypothetical protein